MDTDIEYYYNVNIAYKTRFRGHIIHVRQQCSNGICTTGRYNNIMVAIKTEFIIRIILYNNNTLYYTQHAAHNITIKYILANCCCSAIVETRKCRVCAYFLSCYAQ